LNASNRKLDSKLNEAQLLFNHKQFELCLLKINKIIKHYKNEYLPYNYRGIILLSLKKYIEALEDFKKSTSLNPSFSEGYNNLGLACVGLNREDQAIDAYKKALSINPNAINTKINLGILYSQIYLYPQAIEVLQSVLGTIPLHEHSHQLIADIYLKLLKYDLALSHHIKAREINPLNFMNYYLIGSDYLWRGDKGQASINFRKALDINPNYCQSFYGLSRVENIKADDPLFHQAINLLNNSSLQEEEKVYLNFFIAKVFESSNNPDLFFKYLNQGSSLQNQMSQYNFEQSKKIQINIENCYEKNISILQAKFSKLDLSEQSNSPIFIVGMPRSGTSLLEQILSNHSEIFGAGELNIIHSEMEKIFSTPHDIDKLIEKLLALRKIYLNHLRTISDKKFITDKLPLNFHWLGFIKLIFPQSKILHIKRSPIATSFSIYKTLFTKGSLNFSYNFNHIINYYRLYEGTIKFWSKHLTDDIMHIDYEELVKEPFFYAKEMCRFVNLPFEDDITNLSLNNRPVLTASDLQIRNEIYTNSSKSWEKYRDFLQEFIKAFN
jgi:tetratricopeptide (TPR) repeat protein